MGSPTSSTKELSTVELSTVEITKEVNKITTNVENVTFSHQFYSCKDSFLTRSRKKEVSLTFI